MQLQIIKTLANILYVFSELGMSTCLTSPPHVHQNNNSRVEESLLDVNNNYEHTTKPAIICAYLI